MQEWNAADEKTRVRQIIHQLAASIEECKDKLLPPGERWVGGHDARVDADMLEGWQSELSAMWAVLADIEQEEMRVPAYDPAYYDPAYYDPAELLDYDPTKG